MLNHQRRLTLPRPTAAPTVTQLRVVLTLHVLFVQVPEAVTFPSFSKLETLAGNLDEYDFDTDKECESDHARHSSP